MKHAGSKDPAYVLNMPRTLAAAARFYRAGLYFYPPAFRREFGAEMGRDFEEATGECWADGGWRAVLGLWMHTSADLAMTAAVQWLRSGLPAIGLVATFFAFLTVTAAAQLRRVTVPVPLTEADRDLVTVAVMAIVVLLIIVAILVFNLWFSRSLIRRLPSARRF
jgi:hypothetical protein